jgi:hypothetical protein
MIELGRVSEETKAFLPKPPMEGDVVITGTRED